MHLTVPFMHLAWSSCAWERLNKFCSPSKNRSASLSTRLSFSALDLLSFIIEASPPLLHGPKAKVKATLSYLISLPLWETQKIDSPDNNSTVSTLGCWLLPTPPPFQQKKMCSGGYRFFCAKLDDSSFHFIGLSFVYRWKAPWPESTSDWFLRQPHFSLDYQPCPVFKYTQIPLNSCLFFWGRYQSLLPSPVRGNVMWLVTENLGEHIWTSICNSPLVFLNTKNF